jgi:hypothetical protein
VENVRVRVGVREKSEKSEVSGETSERVVESESEKSRESGLERRVRRVVRVD